MKERLGVDIRLLDIRLLETYKLDDVALSVTDDEADREEMVVVAKVTVPVATKLEVVRLEVEALVAVSTLAVRDVRVVVAKVV